MFVVYSELTNPANAVLLIKPPADKQIRLVASTNSIEGVGTVRPGLLWRYADDDGAGGVTTGFTVQDMSGDDTAFVADLGGVILKGPWATTQPVVGNAFAGHWFDERSGWVYMPTSWIMADTKRGGLTTDRAVCLTFEGPALTTGDKLQTFAYFQIK